MKAQQNPPPSLTASAHGLEFEKRKQDHITQSLSDKNQAAGLSGLDAIRLRHEALPDLDFDEVVLTSHIFEYARATPLYINSMTAGHPDGTSLNLSLAEGCAERGWALGVGSQRRELFDPQAKQEWKILRERFPNLFIFGNLGISQLIRTSLSNVQRLVDGLQPQALAIHLNALQECIQPEGTPQFRGGLKAIAQLVSGLSVPVVVKETGCGMSAQTVARLLDAGVRAIDVSGMGGTHWGRIEGARAGLHSERQVASETFASWGIPTVLSLSQAVAQIQSSPKKNASQKCELWASGGVRTGLDAAKLFALGASAVGFAQPALAPALKGPEALKAWMKQIEFELRIALFCTGAPSVKDICGRLQ